MAKFLVIDDSRVIREKLKILIVQSGNEVIAEASDGNQGVMLYKLLKPDMVTVDVHMKETNGIQAMEEILAFDPAASVVVISSVDDEEIVKRALDGGAKAYLFKPFEKEIVIEQIKRMSQEKKA